MPDPETTTTTIPSDAAPEPLDGDPLFRIVIVTGMSGAGNTSAARVLEDIGYTVIENIAPALLESIADHAAARASGAGLAVVVDARVGDEYRSLLATVERLRARYRRVDLLFLDANDAALVLRYKENRRPHPLHVSDGPGGLLDAIAAERALLAEARDAATTLIDTSDLTVPDLRTALEAVYSGAPGSAPRLNTTITSFGFKHGVPLDVDLVFDVRFLRNPYWVSDLRPFDGTQPEVRDYVFGDPNAAPLLAKLYDLIDFSLPLYQREGKSYLTIGIGCTGGRHRSVAIAEALASLLRDKGHRVSVLHRDIPSQRQELEP